eukprot:CAMPEP_0175808536 /NCGR_PEP_ID=MMETSP0107_2-20121207/2311_1 /TAXON_ID=195067 ORGANISM="Goniomonas pacifica, Strain CCMP1869" /NCGR_SAMPLE_ID=MMETSP0107_2 /ASSEMBLY_ACC=CAM_ASM_000203 /LENGTH=68 /DNA_ID=CAMNT_0017120169 /DNA_START=108 /DNA_END=314 /DNA_ORIENTATION=-
MEARVVSSAVMTGSVLQSPQDEMPSIGGIGKSVFRSQRSLNAEGASATTDQGECVAKPGSRLSVATRL